MQSLVILKHGFVYFIFIMDCFIVDFILSLFSSKLLQQSLRQKETYSKISL